MPIQLPAHAVTGCTLDASNSRSVQRVGGTVIRDVQRGRKPNQEGELQDHPGVDGQSSTGAACWWRRPCRCDPITRAVMMQPVRPWVGDGKAAWVFSACAAFGFCKAALQATCLRNGLRTRLQLFLASHTRPSSESPCLVRDLLCNPSHGGETRHKPAPCRRVANRDRPLVPSLFPLHSLGTSPPHKQSETCHVAFIDTTTRSTPQR